MSIYRLSLKSGKKGNAKNHSNYLFGGNGSDDSEKRSDLVYTNHGNFPSWANGAQDFFAAADKYERKNAAAYREFELALPVELDREAQIRVINKFTEKVVEGKPYVIAFHEPKGAISGEKQPHVHLMFSDRKSDGIERPKEQFFRRYNPTHPERGGCKKDSGGKHPLELTKQLLDTRTAWAKELNNELARSGRQERVDHRSLREQGIDRKPEQYLGPARIRTMAASEKEALVKHRVSKRS